MGYSIEPTTREKKRTRPDKEKSQKEKRKVRRRVNKQLLAVNKQARLGRKGRSHRTSYNFLIFVVFFSTRGRGRNRVGKDSKKECAGLNG